MADKIIDLARRVEERQRQAIEDRSDKGYARELGLLFGQTTAICHGVVIPDPTDKEMGQIKDLVVRYGAREAKWLIIKAAKHWKELYAEPSLHNVMTPTPVFGTLYAFRDKIMSFLKHYAATEEKRAAPLEKAKGIQQQPKSIEKSVGRGQLPRQQQLSFTEMVQIEREKMRKEKR